MFDTLIIRPVMPIGYGMPFEMNVKTAVQILLSSMLFFTVYAIVRAIIKRTPDKTVKERDGTLCYVISEIVAVIMFLLFGWTTELFKGLIFFFILLYASLCDIQTRRVSDAVSVMIFITGFIALSFSDTVMHLIGALLIGGIMFVCAMLSKSRLGGADVKLTAASTFVIGMWNSVAGLIIGLILSVILTIIFNRKKKLKEMSCPLVPYLSIGFMAMYLIGGI